MTYLRSTALVIATLAVAACGLVPPEPQADGADCILKERLNARLHVDPGDERYIWATDIGTAAAISLRIPGGYGVTPDGNLIDPADQAIGRTGDLLVSGCRDIIQNAFMIDESDIRRAR
jgi:hypothetical protein